MTPRHARAEVQALLAQLAGSDLRQAVEAAGALGARREYGAAPDLLEVLSKTSDPGLRNAAAIAVSDMRIPEAFNVIVDLLRQEHTRGYRGTLLYALEPYDCGPILPLLVDLVIEDNFEVAREAAYLIDHMETFVDEKTWDQVISKLEAAYRAADPPFALKDAERREEVIGPVLQMFYDSLADPDPGK